jgi:hypothetical protein
MPRPFPNVPADTHTGGPWDALEVRLLAVPEARKNRLRVMAARLARRGIMIDVESLISAASRRSIGRPDLARAMVAANAASSVKDAFARHLYDDRSAHYLRRYQAEGLTGVEAFDVA